MNIPNQARSLWLQEDLPPWLRFPDVVRVQWLNSITQVGLLLGRGLMPSGCQHFQAERA